MASELLATCATLGGLLVADNKPQSHEAIADALASAGDWRYSPRWLMEAWDPSDDVATLTVARAAITGWADEHRSGLIVYVYGGALHADEGLVGAPMPLHSYLLAVTRSADGTDTVDTADRIVLSCPGEHWCHRSGCPEAAFPEVTALLAPIIAAADAAEAAGGSSDSRWAENYHQLYGDGDAPEYTDGVIEQLSALLSRNGWIELDQSTWEGGLEQTLLRRGEHCLTAAYDPVTRQIQLTDGRAELGLTLQLLADDGVITGHNGQENIELSEVAVEQWGTDLLSAADDLLHERITELARLTDPVQITVLGLHPHADGSLRAPEAAALAERQFAALLDTIGDSHH